MNETPAMKRYLTMREAAAQLSCSVDTVRRLIDDGTLPGYVIEKTTTIRVDSEDLPKALAPIRTHTLSDINE